MPGGRPSGVAIHERLAFEVDELRQRLGGLPLPHEAEHIWTEIWRHEAHNSTAIGGNTLILKEVEILLSEGRAVGDKQLKDYLEVTGYADAAQWVYGQAPGAWSDGSLISLTEIPRRNLAERPPVGRCVPSQPAREPSAAQT
jgi:hypothetical protein